MIGQLGALQRAIDRLLFRPDGGTVVRPVIDYVLTRLNAARPYRRFPHFDNRHVIAVAGIHSQWAILEAVAVAQLDSGQF